MRFSKSANEAARAAAEERENEPPVVDAHEARNRFSKTARLERERREQMSSCDLLTMDPTKYLEIETESRGVYRIYTSPDHTRFFLADMLVNSDAADPKEFQGKKFDAVTAEHLHPRVGEILDGGTFRASRVVSMILKDK